MNHRLFFLLPLLALGLSGCADFLTKDTKTAGARPLLLDYEQVDLVSLLDPKQKAQQAYGAGWGTLPPGQQIDLAFAAFHTQYPTEPERKRRDDVQERLLGVSNQACSRYLSYLQTVNSNGNFALGSLATIAGAAGAIATGGASQVLAGAAGALSGVRAEFNQDYFSNLTVSVIASGIKLERQEVYDQISKYGQANDVDKYPVEAAVKDALFYHGECSLIAGVEKAGQSVQMAADPGMDAVNRILLKVNIARQISQSGTTDPTKLLGAGGIGSSGQLLMAGTVRTGAGIGDGGSSNLPLADLIATETSLNSFVQGETTRVNALTHLPATTKPADLVKTITAAKTTLITAIDKCSKDATTASSAILDAVTAQSKATSDVDKANAAQKVQLMVLQGDLVTAKFKSAASAFTDQTQRAVNSLVSADADADAKTPKGTISADTVTSATTAITNAGSLSVGCSGS